VGFELKDLNFSNDFQPTAIQTKQLTKDNTTDEEITYIAKKILHLHEVQYTDSVFNKRISLIKSEIASPNYIIVTARCNNIIIGFMCATYQKQNKRTTMISHIFTEPNLHETQEQSTSTALFTEILSYSKAKKAKKIMWISDSEQTHIWSKSGEIKGQPTALIMERIIDEQAKFGPGDSIPSHLKSSQDLG
jgi:hypothetical protein